MSGRFLAFGEVLFDVFPSYTRLGGAPLKPHKSDIKHTKSALKVRMMKL